MKSLIFYLIIALSLPLGNTHIAHGQSSDHTEIVKIDISFISGGLMVKGWLFMPAGSTSDKLPAIVMAPGNAVGI